jgi:hypothetical protein
VERGRTSICLVCESKSTQILRLIYSQAFAKPTAVRLSRSRWIFSGFGTPGR